MMIDSHIHTHYSHGSSEVFEVIEYAIEQGMTNIGFSEHYHYKFFKDLGLPTIQGCPVDGISPERFKLYHKSVERAKKYYKNKINIRLGVEVDYLEDKKEALKKSLNEQPFLNDYKEKNPKRHYDFDFIMGATHFIGSPLKYFSDYEHKGNNWMIDAYFTAIKDCIKSKLFDIIAHPDLIKFFVDKKEKDYLHYLEEIVDLLDKHKMAVDVNTDYMKSSKTGLVDKERIMPSPKMLKMCHEKNIPLVLGSDAHRSEKIANNFQEAKKLLKNLGINTLYYFEKRILVDYKI